MFAARITDMHVCPLVNGVVPHVGGPIITPIMGKPCLIGNLPAAGMGSQCVCVGPPDTVTVYARNVMVNNTALGRMGDMTAHGGTIVLGCFTVLVGAGGIDISSISNMASQAASTAATAMSEASQAMDAVAAANNEINSLLEKGNLSEHEQHRLRSLQNDYGESIEGMGMNDEDFQDWTK